VLQGRQRSQQVRKHVLANPGERQLHALKPSFAVTEGYFLHCSSLQQQQQRADKHDAPDMGHSDVDEQSDENTQQQHHSKDNAADLTEQSTLDDLPPLFGSAVSALYTAASGTCFTK
jgi:hypothetical protein